MDDRDGPLVAQQVHDEADAWSHGHAVLRGGHGSLRNGLVEPGISIRNISVPRCRTRSQPRTSCVLCSCASSSARYWCTTATPMLPSPTAAETRLMEAWRTSPTARMPGTLVSSR